MHQTNLNFLHWYKNIAAYGPSRFQNKKTAEKDPFGITESEFFEKIYITTNLESNLFNEVTNINNGNIIALCGPAGSGKSTTSSKVKNSLTNQLRTKVFFIDLRIEESGKTFDDIKSIDDKHVRDLIQNQLNQEFPLLIEQDYSDRYDLYHFLLSPEADVRQLKQSQVFYSLDKIVQKATHLYNKTNKGRNSFRVWFNENFTSSDLIDIFQELDNLMDISHYIPFITYQEKYDNIIFWLDNIDSFTNIQQTQIVDILEKLQRNILNDTKIVISVREENIYRVGRFTDNFNEPFISQVTFKDPSENPSFSQCGAINVPVMSGSDLNKITYNKLCFGFEKYLLYEDLLTAKLKRFETELEKLKSTNIVKYNINREDNLKQKRKLEKDINEFRSRRTSNVEFENIKKLSVKINDSFTSEKVIFLANNSIKTYLRIHGEFLYYLAVSNDQFEGKPTFEDLSQSQITTIFLSWIHTVNQPFGVETFNVIEELGNYQNSPTDTRIGCFLPYIILTRIWNECVHLHGKPSPNNNPFVKLIIDDIAADFGFSKEKIAYALFLLYHQVEGKGNFITFRTKQPIENPNNLLELNTSVRITYRGRVTLGHILNSYGYLRECTERLHVPTESEMSLDELIVTKVSHICEIHLTQLVTIRNIVYKNNKLWYQDYLRRYGIPMMPEFVRNANLGRPLPNVQYNRSLYLESLFGSLTNFYQLSPKIKIKIEQINTQFNSILNKIVDNQNIEIILIETE